MCEVTLSDVPAMIFDPTVAPTAVRAAVSSGNSHTSSIQSFLTVVSEAVDWATFSVWLTVLLNRHGNQILRFKSVIALPDSGKLVVQGIRHRVYPPQHLPADEQDDGLSRLVFITDGIEHVRILQSLSRLTSTAARSRSVMPAAPALI